MLTLNFMPATGFDRGLVRLRETPDWNIPVQVVTGDCVITERTRRISKRITSKRGSPTFPQHEVARIVGSSSSTDNIRPGYSEPPEESAEICTQGTKPNRERS